MIPDKLNRIKAVLADSGCTNKELAAKIEVEETTENVEEMVVNTHSEEAVEGAPEEEAKKAA